MLIVSLLVEANCHSTIELQSLTYRQLDDLKQKLNGTNELFNWIAKASNFLPPEVGFLKLTQN